MKNDTQFRNQNQGNSKFPMNNKIVGVEKKLEEQHAQQEAATEKAEAAKPATLSKKLVELKKTVKAGVEAFNESPQVIAAKSEVTAWVKEKAHDVEVAVPKVVARVSKMMKAKTKAKPAAKKKSAAKGKTAVKKARGTK